MFKKILVANRGEIAVRILRAAREMGIETVAIYDEVDIAMPFVHAADSAYKVSGVTPKAAYLDMEQIIGIALMRGCEAIHPGYGFLSENAEFAKAVNDAGIKFIGPFHEAIEAMGNKTVARELMEKAGVPIVPGGNLSLKKIQGYESTPPGPLLLDGEVLKELKEIAGNLKYPVLLKAAAGGGGKGMRRVDKEEDLLDNFEAARREALKSFGDDSIYMEKFMEDPKHIEIQIIADEYGNYAHLGERDCSIQRRHQKVIEESPSTVLDEVLRERMGKVALDAARAVNYVNAGTVEFLLDKNKNFYFLEMNTRLQVEHPVTEMVTQINIVKEQISIASGEKLSFKQEDVKWRGHAIECRIYAEDSFNNFMPMTGKISYMREPGGYGVRVDSGVENGSEIGIHFDPMLAKLIVWAKNRSSAIDRMERALKNYRIKGLKTTIPFELAVMRNDIFKEGVFDTGFIEKNFKFEVLDEMKSEYEEIVAALAAYGYRRFKSSRLPEKGMKDGKLWKTVGRAKALG